MKVFDADFYKKLQTIGIKTKIQMSQGLGGSRKSRSKGSSVEFSDYREYSAGDDFRRVDWNAYGRFDKLFVKLFMEEREALINIFIDSSKSMDFGSAKKSELTLKLAAVISFVGLNNLDRVCINVLTDRELRQSQIMTGRSNFERTVKFLEGIEFSGNTNINSCIKSKEFNSKGVSIIISDFFTPGGIEEAVKYLLYKKQDIILLNILSQEETAPDFEGYIRFIDSETGSAKDVAVTSAIIKRYKSALKNFTDGLKELSSRLGVSYIQIDSGQSLEKIIFEDLIRMGIIA